MLMLVKDLEATGCWLYMSMAEGRGTMPDGKKWDCYVNKFCVVQLVLLYIKVLFYSTLYYP